MYATFQSLKKYNLYSVRLMTLEFCRNSQNTSILSSTWPATMGINRSFYTFIQATMKVHERMNQQKGKCYDLRRLNSIINPSFINHQFSYSLTLGCRGRGLASPWCGRFGFVPRPLREFRCAGERVGPGRDCPMRSGRCASTYRA